MLNLYTENNLPKHLELIKEPWYNYFNSNNIYGKMDELDKEIVAQIENVKAVSSNGLWLIESKFLKDKNGNAVLIPLSELSEGCKTVLSIHNIVRDGKANNYIINISSCGANAIKCIVEKFGDIDVNVYCMHTAFGTDENMHVHMMDINKNIIGAKKIRHIYAKLISGDYWDEVSE